MIIFPMAGKGLSFKKAGYKMPKPLIKIKGKPMIEWALSSFPKNNLVFIVLKEQSKQLKPHLKGQVIEVDTVTQGAACTVLLAEKLITNEELIVANCDQYLKFNWSKFITHARKYDGCLLTFNATNPHHSYARVVNNRVVQVAEKKVISDHASGGVYYFKHGTDFVKATKEMIRKNIRTNNEFYICPVYQELINKGKKIGYFEIDNKNKFMIGNPDELNIFIDKINNKEI
jgi:dTDP-glucose pyrophosphorylase